MTKLHEYFLHFYTTIPKEQVALYLMALPTESKEVRDYLIHTRHEKIGAETNTMYYNTLFQPVFSVMQKHGLQSSLLITYSMNRRTEAIQIGGDWHIIHDQYLAKAFNLFNKIVRELRDPEVVTQFCFRYLVEQFRINGMAVEADIFFSIGLEQGVFEKLNESYRSLSERPEVTYAQETFMLFHELAHILVKRNPRLLKYRKKEIMEFIEAMPVLRFLNLIPRSSGKKPDEHFKNELLEEIFCDYLAVKFTVDTFKSTDLVNTGDLITSIHHCMRMVRTMSILSSLVEGFPKSRASSTKIELDDSFVHSSIRLHAMKYSFSLIFAGTENEKEAGDALDEILENFSDEDQFFEDPIFQINSILNELATKKNLAIPEVSYADKIEIYDYLDQSLGWKPRRPTN